MRKLRDEISDKKTLITTVTKGIPFNKIEVRPQGQLPKHSGPQGGMEQKNTRFDFKGFQNQGWYQERQFKIQNSL